MSIETAKRRRSANGAASQQGPPNWALRTARELKLLEAAPLAGLDWLIHGFSTRSGGRSEPAALDQHRAEQRGALNLGFTEWDLRGRVIENRRKFYRALGATSMRPVMLRQVHSDLIHLVVAAGDKQTLSGDAAITRKRGMLLVVQTADCVPILLADTKKRAVAAVHSGWRGTLRSIAAKTLGRMRMEFQTRPEDVIAAIGPSIGRCCYEVGAEVAREFDSQFREARAWFDGPFDALAAGENDPNWLPWLTMRPPGHAPPSPRVKLDLVAANRSILANAGVPKARIFSCDFCTACRTDLFFSYRREHATGRLMAAIGIR